MPIEAVAARSHLASFRGMSVAFAADVNRTFGEHRG